MSGDARGPAPGYADLARVFLRISLLGFGGPNAHLALMLDEVVERRGWLGREHFLHLIGITNLLPGPNSSEVAIHVGYTQRGWRGAFATGLAFLAPTFVLVVLLSFLYFRFGTLPLVEELFWGLKPAVVAIILGAGWRLGRTAVTDARLLGLACGGVAVALLLERWEVAAMAAGGLVGWLLYRREGREGPAARGEPEPALPDVPAPGPQDGERRHGGRLGLTPLPLAALALGTGEAGRLFALMLWTGSILFGGGYMLVALIEPYVVQSYGWLTPEQFLDGVAMIQAVPGPIVTLAAFVGYGVAGIGGAALATAGIYIPSFAAVLAVAPLLDRWRRLAAVRAALRGVNAVVAGAIFGVGLSLLPPAIPDPAAALLFMAALAALALLRVGSLRLIAAGLAVGAVRALLLLG